MKLCTPIDCEWCVPWGSSVPNKAKCCKPPVKDNPNPGYEYHRGWNYSTELGGSCVNHKDTEQLTLFSITDD